MLNYDYDGFDPFDEMGLLRKSQIDSIRASFEDVIDRLYVEDEDIDCDELDVAIRDIANNLGVYVPNAKLEITQDKSFENLEYIINKDYYKVKTLYRQYTPCTAFILLRYIREEKDCNTLSISELARFCYSDEFNAKNGDQYDVQ